MQTDGEIIWQKVLSFFKREYDNTILNTSMLSIRRIFQISLISFSFICALIMGGATLVAIIVGLSEGDYIEMCIFALMTAIFTIYLISLANRIINSLSRDYHKEVMELFNTQPKLFIRECAVVLGVVEIT